MKIQNTFFKKSLVVLAMSAGLFNLPAYATTVNIGASVTVNNTINVAFTPMNLGTISATKDDAAGAEIATMVLSPNPATAPVATNGATSDATMVVLSAGSPATVTVSGAASNYALTVTLPAAPVTLSDPAGASTDTFTLDTFTKYATTEGNNHPIGTTTDATGNLVFNVGATLKTVANGAAPKDLYDETTYTGTFAVTVSY